MKEKADKRRTRDGKEMRRGRRRGREEKGQNKKKKGEGRRG